MICEICKYEGKFISHRNILNRKCPKCKSLERQRNFYRYIIDHNLLKDRTLLHVAPEKSLTTILSNNSKYYLGIDLNIPEERPFLSKLDLTDMSILTSNSFDSVICFHVLEHIKDDTLALVEMKRILKDGGLLFLSVPIKSDNTYLWTEDHIKSEQEKGLWGIPGKYDGHYRTYGKEELKLKLEELFPCVEPSNTPITSDEFFICRK